MKDKLISLFASVAILIGAAAPLPAQELVLHYDFDAATGIQVPDLSKKSNPAEVTGLGIVGGSGSGLTGGPKDLAFDNTASAMGEFAAKSGGSVMLPLGLGPVKSFTITLWYKNESGQAVPQGTRLFEMNRGTETGLILCAVNNFGGLIFMDGQRVLLNSTTPLPADDKWTFVAITYDGSQGTENVHLYVGSPTEPATEAASNSAPEGPFNWGDDLSQLRFGASSSDGRALAGFFDEIRLQIEADSAAGALSLDAIRVLQAQDLGNQVAAK